MIVVAFLLILTVVVYRFWKRHSWAPPGPTGVPLLGCLPWLDPNNPSKKLVDWAQRYGNCYHVQLGSNNYMVLGDAGLIRESFCRTELESRPPMASIDLVEAGDGIVFSSGKRWRYTRRFTLYHLRNLGLGRSCLEPVILDQVDDFIDHTLQQNANIPVSIGTSLDVAIVNTLWYIMTSEKLSLNDHSIHEQVELMQRLFSEEIASYRMVDYIPALTYIIPRFIFDSEKYLHKVTEATKFISTAIEKHRVKMNSEEMSGALDYIDALLLEQRKEPIIYTDHHISRCLLDLFAAGSDTTSTTLRWAIVVLADHAEVAKRIESEIDTVSQKESEHILLEHRAQMPYTEAFLHELQRYANILPFGVPRFTTGPINVAGYDVPAGTIFISLLSAVHFDDDHFKQPYSFMPERFLSQGDPPVFKPDPHVMSFGTGKRQCIGQHLARDELFLFLTNILKRFDLQWPRGQRPRIETKLIDDFISSPTSFNIVPVPRRLE